MSIFETISKAHAIIYLPDAMVSCCWKSAIGAEQMLVSLTLVNIQRKEKCVQNVTSLFIGLLIIKKMILLKLSNMNLLRDHVVCKLKLPRMELKRNYSTYC
jgi:hypothetical protein